MNGDKWYDVWEDWVFESEGRFWLTYSRALFSLAFIVASFVASFVIVVSVAKMFGPLMVYLIVGIVGFYWVRWTLTGGKSR